MTNHGETTGSFENDDITGREGQREPDSHPVGEAVARITASAHSDVLDERIEPHRVTLRTPAELADALPYLLGYRPEDSVVLAALHDKGGNGRFGGRARLGIPANPDDWASVAAQLARGLVTGGARRGARPKRMVAYLCQEPADGETGRQVMERLRPLAEHLRFQCSLLEAPVIEALCISDGRFWSYCCPRPGCCPEGGQSMGLPGTSVLAAAATYAGLQVRGTLRELRARLLPWETGAALEQEIALDAANRDLVPRILDQAYRADVAEKTLALAEHVIGRLAKARPVTGTLTADLRDDELIGHEEAAALILGLQDRTTRDRAAEWMEGEEAGPALRLWRALARRCVGPYGEHAAAPLTLAGWVAWSTGDDLEAREALAMALGADSDYLFARLLHQAINEGLDPESVRRCLRAERAGRTAPESGGEGGSEGEGEGRSDGLSKGESEGVNEGVVVGEGAGTHSAPDADAPPAPGADAHPVPAASTEAPIRRRRPARALTTEARTARTRLAARRALRARTAAAGTHPGAGRAGGTRPRPSGKRPARRHGAGTGSWEAPPSGGSGNDAQEET
ncbi:DUF4192 domain-containing protein [Streptomyces sp. NPDC001595]|uniref:DUF4192 domain-containing protein n=1 Tax=Streptomyces sp. NPDC001532 TaxID=3154520 RepID=UPI003318C745